MNKTHRIVWSEARQTYVVAHENAASSGKPSSTRKGVVQAVAVAAALLALGAGQVFAADICFGNGDKIISGVQTPGDFCRLTQPDSVLVEPGAAITGAGWAMFATYGVTAGAFGLPCWSRW